MKSLRVALFNLYPRSSGIGRYSFSLFEELKKYNISISMIHFEKSSAMKLIVGMNYPKHVEGIYDLYHIANSELGMWSKVNRPCVFTLHDIITYGRDIKREPTLTPLYPKPFSLHPEETYFWNRWMRKSIEAAIVNSEKIICTSHYVEKKLKELIKVPEHKLRVIYYGLNHDLFRPRDKLKARNRLNLPRNRLIILHVGGDGANKNIRTLLKAVKVLQRYTDRFLLIRIGKHRKDTRKLMQKLGIARCVLPIEYVSSSDIALFYNAADLYVHPSIYEGFGFPPLEAIASGCPVLSSNSAALPEILGNAALYFEPYSVDDLVELIIQVLNDATLRERLINMGLSRAKIFSWRRAAEETMKVYESVVSTLI
ncbi:MAG: glycosyltransferase family 1 protein [Thermoprotei archaeon]